MFWAVMEYLMILFGVTMAYLFVTPLIDEIFSAFSNAGYGIDWLTNMLMGFWYFFLFVILAAATMWLFGQAQRREPFEED